MNPITLALLLLASTSSGDPGSSAKLEVFPAVAALEGPVDRQSFVVRRIDADGVTTDLTDVAQFSFSAEGVAKLDGRTLLPVADGQVALRIEAEGMTIELPVSCANIGKPIPPTSFRLDVVPVLSKSGCNNGSCHGSARGQDGFHLTLFGYDPTSDYRELTRNVPGRRTNLAYPEESLLLTKSIGAVAHTGGKRFDASDPRYTTILNWIRQGAQADKPDVPRVVGLEMLPPAPVLIAGNTQQCVVRARYSDGTDRDVTSLTTFISSNEYSVKVSETGLVQGSEPGEAHVLARYDEFAVGTPLIVLPPDAPPPPQMTGANWVDDQVNAKLFRLRITPSGLCDDETFLRRVTIDLTGLLPTPEQRQAFLADTATDKRAKLIDSLMDRKEFTEIWVMKWAERLGIRSTQEVSLKATLLYSEWLQSRIATRVPIDRIVLELLSAQGGTFEMPATNFYQLETDTLKLTENVAQAFLGTRIQCAQCHNHPFDRWTMDDYYGFAAFFSQIGRKGGEDPRETIVFNSGSGEMKHPVGGKDVTPRFLGEKTPDLKGEDRRRALARWLTAPENRMFARNVANFTWAHFFHRGIVEPVDDVRVSNPPSNEPLLDALASKLVEYKFDIRPLVRDICNSHAYQRTTQPNESNQRDETNFSHAVVRRIRAEFLLDSITLVTGEQEKFQGLPLGSRAVQIADGTSSNYFLTTFGRAKRATVCTCEVVMEPSLSQALHLINGDTVNAKIRQGDRVAKELAAGRTPEQILTDLFISTLCREPTADEREHLLSPIKEGADAKSVLEDAFWALLNSREFLFNH